MTDDLHDGRSTRHMFFVETEIMLVTFACFAMWYFIGTPEFDTFTLLRRGSFLAVMIAMYMCSVISITFKHKDKILFFVYTAFVVDHIVDSDLMSDYLSKNNVSPSSPHWFVATLFLWTGIPLKFVVLSAAITTLVLPLRVIGSHNSLPWLTDAVMALYFLLIGISYYHYFFRLGLEICRIRQRPLRIMYDLPSNFFLEMENRALGSLPLSVLKKRLSRDEHLYIISRLTQIPVFREAVLQLIAETPKAEAKLNDTDKLERAFLRRALLQYHLRKCPNEILQTFIDDMPLILCSKRSLSKKSLPGCSSSVSAMKSRKLTTKNQSFSKIKILLDQTPLETLAARFTETQKQSLLMKRGENSISTNKPISSKRNRMVTVGGVSFPALRIERVTKVVRETQISKSGHSFLDRLFKHAPSSLEGHSIIESNYDVLREGQLRIYEPLYEHISNTGSNEYVHFSRKKHTGICGPIRRRASSTILWFKAIEGVMVDAQWHRLPLAPKLNLLGHFSDIKIERWFLSWASAFQARLIINQRLIIILGIVGYWFVLWTLFLTASQKISPRKSIFIYLGLRTGIQSLILLGIESLQSFKYYDGTKNSHFFKRRATFIALTALFLSLLDVVIFEKFFPERDISYQFLYCIIVPFPVWCQITSATIVAIIMSFSLTSVIVIPIATSYKDLVSLTVFDILRVYIFLMLWGIMMSRVISKNYRLLFCRYLLPYLLYLDALQDPVYDDDDDDENTFTSGSSVYDETDESWSGKDVRNNHSESFMSRIDERFSSI